MDISDPLAILKMLFNNCLIDFYDLWVRFLSKRFFAVIYGYSFMMTSLI